MARRKRKDQEWSGAITVLTGELSDLNASVDRVMEMARQAERPEAIDRAAVRVVAATAERKRIKEINKFVNGKTLVELRMRGGPIATLINNHNIGGEEMMAIMDIELAITALSGGLMFKPINYEPRVSAGMKADWSGNVARAVERYKAWANFWARRQVLHNDRTLGVVIAAVIDGRAFRNVESDLNIKNGRGVTICIRGLRDYAARGGEVIHRVAVQWMDDALKSFPDRGALAIAMARHKAVRLEETAS